MTRAQQPTTRERSKTLLNKPIVALIVACLLSGCSVTLLADLNESAASDVIVTLSQSDIAARKDPDPNKEDRYTVSVANDDVALALTALRNAGVPNQTAPGVLASLGESALVPTRNAEHARLVAGTSGELETSLTKISGVLSARVHLAVPERSAFDLPNKNQQAASASVLIRHRGATPPLAVEDVQRLVSGAVSGLRPEAVAVVMHPVVLAPMDKEQAMSRIGPLSVSRSSMRPLKLLLLGIAALNVALLAAVLFLWGKLRSVRTATHRTEGAP